jgi:hypothetical protein
MSDSTLLYLIGGGAAVLSLAAWLWLIAVPAWMSYARWWERVVAMLLSVYVLAAMVLAGAGLGAVYLFYNGSI